MQPLTPTPIAFIVCSSHCKQWNLEQWKLGVCRTKAGNVSLYRRFYLEIWSRTRPV